MISYLILSILPLAAGLAVARRRVPGMAPAYVYGVGFYMVGMVSLDGFALPGTLLSAGVLDQLRVLTHLVAFLPSIGVWALASRPKSKLLPGYALAISVLFAGWALSLLANGVSQSEFARLAIAAVYFWVLFVAVPQTFRHDQVLEAYSRLFIGVGVGLAAIALMTQSLYGSYAEWAVRLGRPLNPRVFAAAMLLAFILSLFITRQPLLAGFFALMVVNSGTRTAILAVVMCVGLKYAHKRLIVALGLALFVVALFTVDLEAVVGSSDLLNRSDPTAGRTLFWQQTIGNNGDTWLFGTGQQFQAYNPGTRTIGRLHNGFLEGLLSYGILYVIGSTIFSATTAWITARIWLGGSLARDERLCLLMLVIYMGVEFLVGALYWTNLGDSFSFSAIVILQILFTRSAKQTVEAHGTQQLSGVDDGRTGAGLTAHEIGSN